MRAGRLRVFGPALVAAGVLLGAPSAAIGAREDAWPAPADVAVVADAHHVVHYSAGGVGAASAQSALAELGTARASFLTLGFRPPPPDSGRGGDDRYDLYLCTPGTVCFGRSTRGGAAVEPNPMQPFGPAPGFGFVFLHERAQQATLVAHEYFHAWQTGYLARFAAGEPWWGEITAEWAANTGAPAIASSSAPLADNLICTGSGDPLIDPCATGSYGFWPFVSHLVSRFGVAIVHEVIAEQVRLTAAAPGPSGNVRAAVRNVLAAHGTSLPAAFAAFARASLVGGIGRTPLGLPVYRPQFAGDQPVTIGPWGMRLRLYGNGTRVPGQTPWPLGVDVQGLDPALDGAALGTRPLAIPPSGRLRVLIPGSPLLLPDARPGQTNLLFSLTSPSDAPRTTGLRITPRAPVMTMRAGRRPHRRGVTAIRLACPVTVGGCRARLVLRFGFGRRALKRNGPVVTLADGRVRTVTVALGRRLARRLRGHSTARLRVEQVQARPGAQRTVIARRTLVLRLR